LEAVYGVKVHQVLILGSNNPWKSNISKLLHINNMKWVKYAYTFQALVSVQKSFKAAQECN
jgi:hypothetical protein